ncbi:U-scoloptoxin(16)-Ssd1a [Oratosquilla oratoria]|uniref:U-scoloptoxin(16)-Ssd1a n=1 Tax=Oratosquilla oratoria TaxID=337810 RepID=UPI003F75F707
MALPKRVVGVLVLVAVTASVLPSSEAALAATLGVVEPGHSRQCKVDDGDYMDDGDKRQGPHCSTIFCEVEGKEYFLRYEGCGLASADPPCEVVTDSHLPHPKCCPRIVCPP